MSETDSNEVKDSEEEEMMEVGTIDISYSSLCIGLLLLLIPLFYIWKFKTGLLRATVVGTARMIVQLFLIGMYLKYLFYGIIRGLISCGLLS